MGGASIRSTIVSNLNTTLSTLDSEITSLKDSKKTICSELDKYSYQETMVGKDLLELKLGFNSSIDQLSTLINSFLSIPDMHESTNSKKLSLTSSILSIYGSLFTSFKKISELKQQKIDLINDQKLIEKKKLDIENEIQGLKNCLVSNQRFSSDEEAFEYHVKGLVMRKEEMEEELQGRNSPRMLLRSSKSRLQDVVAQMSEEEVLAELEKVRKRNLYLEDYVKYQSRSSVQDIEFALGSQEKQDRVIKEYNSMIREKKKVIEELGNELRGIKKEIEDLQAGILGKMNNEQRMDMLEDIIQKCRASIQKGSKVGFKKLLRKKTLLETVEKTLEKARKVNY